MGDAGFCATADQGDAVCLVRVEMQSGTVADGEPGRASDRQSADVRPIPDAHGPWVRVVPARGEAWLGRIVTEKDLPAAELAALGGIAWPNDVLVRCVKPLGARVAPGHDYIVYRGFVEYLDHGP
jgi:hypothetical protein